MQEIYSPLSRNLVAKVQQQGKEKKEMDKMGVVCYSLRLGVLCAMAFAVGFFGRERKHQNLVAKTSREG